jgi:hypothetical protein
MGNNPLKYRDPTGHMKNTPEQEAVEEGAVIINIALCGVAFVCFGEFVKGVVVVPL